MSKVYISSEMATPRGFEPLISTVTGWHVKPLHHGAYFELGTGFLTFKSLTRLAFNVKLYVLSFSVETCLVSANCVMLYCL
jgi:hypothetical protein